MGNSEVDSHLQFSGRIELLVDSASVVEMSNVKNGVVVIVMEYVHHTASIPVIGHTTTVVDVTSRVYQHLFARRNYSVTQKMPPPEIF